MNQPTAAQTIDALLKEVAELGSRQADLADQLEAVRERRKTLLSAVEGVRLGQALAAEIAASQATPVAGE